MRITILIISLSLIGCNRVKDNHKEESRLYFIDSLVTSDTLIFNDYSNYDKDFVFKKLGKQKFNLLRSEYKQNLNITLDKLKNIRLNGGSLNITEMLTLMKKYDISEKEIKNSIPISPTEFKIYDSCFSDKKKQSKIEVFEIILFKLACYSSNDFALKEELILLYVNMYSYMYKGALLNEERVGDGYYYYGINTLICENNQLFCEKIWAKTNELVKLKNNDLYDLYNCRCVKKVLDEFVSCD